MKYVWIDYLRVLAVIAVVTIHVTSSTYAGFNTLPLDVWWSANILNTLSRFSVPMFVMISGYLLLGRDIGIKSFYIKQSKRLLPAFIFWSFFYVTAQAVFNDWTLSTVFWEMTGGLVISGQTYYHLWYLSMLICLLIFVPFINNYIVGKKPTLQDFVYLLFAIAVFMTLNQLSLMSNIVLGVNMSWFKNFPWFIGYLLAGYFIGNYHSDIRISNKLSLILLFSLLLMSCILNYYLSSKLGVVKDSIVLSNSGVLNFIVTSIIFYLFVKNKTLIKENRAVSSIATASFGIYLIHPVFISLTMQPIRELINKPSVELPLTIAIVLLLSYLTIHLLRKIKVIKTLC